jgi:hypothetical protein
MAGKYMPTHDSNTKRLAMSTPNTEAGEDTAFAAPPKMFDTADPVEIAKVALPIASVANVSIPTANVSVEMDLLFPSLSTLLDEVNCPKRVEPMRQHAMKQEKTVP